MKFNPFYVKTEGLTYKQVSVLWEESIRCGANRLYSQEDVVVDVPLVGVNRDNNTSCSYSVHDFGINAVGLTYEEALLHVQGESISLKLEKDTKEEIPIDTDFSISFIDCHGVACSVQNSSSVLEDRIWLGIDNPKPMILHSRIKEGGTGWVEYPLPEDILICGRMHLNVEQVKKLLPTLENFVKTGNIYDKGDK